MEDIRIAFLQIAPTGTTEGNRVKGELYCRKAKELGADIALFPEMWSSGYGIPEEVELLKALAVSKDGGGFLSGSRLLLFQRVFRFPRYN